MDRDAHDAPENDSPSEHTPRRRKPFGFLFGRVFLTLLTLALLAGIGALATSAMLTDQVTMAPINATGGTLDIKVNSSTTANQDGPNANWGTFSASLTGMKPGETRWADVTLHNPGSLPARVTASTVGSDTHLDDPANDCFGYYFRERDTLGMDVQSIGNGTDWGTSEANTGVIPFDTDIPAASGKLFVDGALRLNDVWAVAESNVYRLTVRMYDGCRQGSGNIGGTTFAAPTGATGTLTFTFDAAQT